MNRITLCLLWLLAACGHSSTILPGSQNKDDQTGTSADISAGGVCPAFGAAEVLGTVTAREIDEASGIAVSRNHDGIFWTHNDSGDDPRVFALNRDGRLVAIYNLEGAENEDWEDIAIGPGPAAGQDYLYIADIGSSGGLPVTIYRFVEPAVSAGQTFSETPLNNFDRIHLRYPDGADYNAETLLVDPGNDDFYIVTKTGRRAFLFHKPAPHNGGTTATLELAATLDLSSSPDNVSATGGEIRRDGSLIAIRTYSHALVWIRSADQTIAQALTAEPCLVLPMEDVSELGEAIAFTPAGDLVTLSEHRNQPFYLYPLQ